MRYNLEQDLSFYNSYLPYFHNKSAEWELAKEGLENPAKESRINPEDNDKHWTFLS